MTGPQLINAIRDHQPAPAHHALAQPAGWWLHTRLCPRAHTASAMMHARTAANSCAFSGARSTHYASHPLPLPKEERQKRCQRASCAQHGQLLAQRGPLLRLRRQPVPQPTLAQRRRQLLAHAATVLW